LVSERNAVGGTHNSGKRYFILDLIFVTNSGTTHVFADESHKVSMTPFVIFSDIFASHLASNKWN